MKLGDSIITVLLAIIGVAIVAVLVSKQAQTGSVLGAGGSAFSQALGCALSPVTGGSCGAGSSGGTTFKLPSLNFPSNPAPTPNVTENITYDMSEYQN